jgi:peptide/nickel transport system substrate-binding protein
MTSTTKGTRVIALSRREFLAATAAILGGVAVAACAPAAAPGGSAVTSPPGPKKLLWGAANMITRVDPQSSATYADLGTYETVFDTLTTRRPPPNNVQIQPRIATEWRLLNDTTWQFKLRSGVKFHNGDPLTAADVKFTMDRAIDPQGKSIWRAAFPLLGSVTVVDDLTVNFNMKAIDPLFPARVIGQGSWIMPAKYFNSVGQDGFEKTPIGSGPFKVAEIVLGDHITLDANKEYWGGAPNAEQIILKAIPEISARITAITQRDESNFTENLPADQVEKVANAPSTKVVDLSASGDYSLTPDLKVKPFDDVRVRQALSLSIDRASILKDLLKGKGRIPSGPIPPGDFSFDSSVPPLSYDPTRARDLLRQANYSNQEVILETTRNYLIDADQALGEALVSMWKTVGFNAKIELLEISVRTQKIAARQFKGMFTAAFSSYLADPDGFMWRILQVGGPLNYNWVDDEFQRLGKEASSSTNADLRQRNYRRMQQIVNEQVPFIPVIEFVQSFGMKKNITFQPGPNTALNFRNDNLKID